MAYALEIPPSIERVFRRLYKKDRAMWNRVKRALENIVERPDEIGDPKRYHLRGCRGVHIGPFVLVWEVHDNRVKVVLFDHHDHAYE